MLVLHIYDPEFAVVNGAPLLAVEPFGRLDGLPPTVLENAREWERHLMEVESRWADHSR